MSIYKRKKPTEGSASPDSQQQQQQQPPNSIPQQSNQSSSTQTFQQPLLSQSDQTGENIQWEQQQTPIIQQPPTQLPLQQLRPLHEAKYTPLTPRPNHPLPTMAEIRLYKSMITPLLSQINRSQSSSYQTQQQSQSHLLQLSQREIEQMYSRLESKQQIITPYIILMTQSAFTKCRKIVQNLDSIALHVLDQRYERHNHGMVLSDRGLDTNNDPNNTDMTGEGEDRHGGRDNNNNNNIRSFLHRQVYEPIYWDIELSQRTSAIILQAETYIADRDHLVNVRLNRFKKEGYKLKFILLILDSSGLVYSQDGGSNDANNRFNSNNNNQANRNNMGSTNGLRNQNDNPNNTNNSSSVLLKSEISTILTDLNLHAITHGFHFITCCDVFEAARYIEIITFLEQETACGSANLHFLDLILQKKITNLGTSRFPSHSNPSSSLSTSTPSSSQYRTGDDHYGSVIKNQVDEILGVTHDRSTQIHRGSLITILSALPSLSDVLLVQLLHKYPSMALIANNLKSLSGVVDGFGATRAKVVESLFTCDFGAVLNHINQNKQ